MRATEHIGVNGDRHREFVTMGNRRDEHGANEHKGSKHGNMNCVTDMDECNTD